jgi:hypothetical protein
VIGVLAAALSFSFAIPNAAHAREKDLEDEQEEESDDDAELEPTQFGVGIQSSWPTFGVSGMLDLDERVSVQGVVGLFGTINMFAARGLYRFSIEEMWSVYGYGAAGAVTHRYLRRERETTLGLGAGVGLEYDWRAWSRKLPPIQWNLELGLAYADFDFYDYTGFSFGAGVHYRF